MIIESISKQSPSAVTTNLRGKAFFIDVAAPLVIPKGFLLLSLLLGKNRQIDSALRAQ